jgi:hypothetical protein
MIELRMINAGEVQEMADFAIEGMQAHKYPLHVSRAKVVHFVEVVRAGAPHFGMAAFKDGRLVGAIAALVAEMPFFERWEAHVIMCRAVAPGAGMRLILSMRDWAAAEMRIRRVQFPIEEGADPRIAKLLERCGFNRFQTNAIYYKG